MTGKKKNVQISEEIGLDPPWMDFVVSLVVDTECCRNA